MLRKLKYIDCYVSYIYYCCSLFYAYYLLNIYRVHFSYSHVKNYIFCPHVATAGAIFIFSLSVWAIM
uniref:Uncharacterized protein n=1 Tax=Lepeophtheirus salmonis TaxID=72036 RepID=A0A0K2TCN0_LEPSM